jgi:ABC-type lipoprotein export system ATPase subunit
MIYIDDVSKIYKTKFNEVKALDNVNLKINDGEFIVIRGASGSGKTTLLLTIGGMLRPTKGKIIIGDSDIYTMRIRERANLRAKNIGFVFQMFHLVPYLNVIENVLLPSKAGLNKLTKEDAMELIRRLHLLGREHHKPSELSAGEKQRTAIARALLNQPKIILADEPTGNLDPDNAGDVIGYLSEFHKNGGTVVVVTHGVIADQYADRIINLKDGQIG